jgi:hypothetical protein
MKPKHAICVLVHLEMIEETITGKTAHSNGPKTAGQSVPRASKQL